MKRILFLIPPNKTMNIILVVIGMAMLLFGFSRMALPVFVIGLLGLEHGWRLTHSDFSGGFRERLEASVAFYESSHTEETNRFLHRVGIPMILMGALGLFWSGGFLLHLLSAGLFAFGWALNIVGHSVYEKNAPAFADDPLSFIAGPLWDIRSKSSSDD